MAQHQTTKRKICCNGGGDLKSKHPLVYLYLEGTEKSCPYCGKTFSFKESHRIKQVKNVFFNKNKES